MYGVLPAVCCCEEPGPPPPGDEYYVFTPCNYFENHCCPPVGGCDEAPKEIIWCNWYAISKGLQPPFDPELCVLIKWNDCCIYQLSGIVEDPCPSPPEPAQNIGDVFAVYVSTEERPCCSPPPADPEDESGCLYKQLFDEETPWTPGPCDDLIAFEYDKYDQFGTVAGKEVKIKTGELSYCYATLGIQYFEKCEDGDPVVYQKATSTNHIQLHGLCIPTDGGLGNCENQRTDVFVEFLTCPECNEGRPCCGDPDPCAGLSPGDQAYDEFCPDPSRTYDIKTCYRVNDCLDDEFNQIWFEQDVMFLDFPWCHSGIDPDDPDVQDLIDAFYIDPSTGIVKTDNVSSITTLWGATQVAVLEVCDYVQTIVSGNANQLASALNNRINDMVNATSIAPWDQHFWFGRRQTCDPCEEFDPALLIPPWSEADELVIDRVVPRTAGPRVYLKGRSKKKYICASKTIDSPLYSLTGPVTTACISATGNADDGFTLQCLSPAEYSSGLRYSMRRVEQVGTFVDICVDLNTSQTVVACQELTGGLNYPITDWNANCLNVLGPTNIKCRSYFHIYEVSSCDPFEPTPIPCIASSCSDCNSYQSSGAFCETEGSVIEIL